MRIRYVCEKGYIAGPEEDVEKNVYRGKKTSDNVGGKPTCGFSLQHNTFSALNYVQDFGTGVCKTRTGYLRMADADGKMRIEKCGWKKMRITKKVRRKKREIRMAKKIY